MSGETLTLDTNVLVYSVDRAAGPRHLIAKDIMLRAALLPCWLTLQSISEFYVVVTQKGMMLPEEAKSIAETMIDLFRVAPPSVAAARSALAQAAAGRVSYWDALLVATAAEAGCTTIFTEDLSHDTTISGVRVINPFGEEGLTPDAAALLTSG